MSPKKTVIVKDQRGQVLYEGPDRRPEPLAMRLVWYLFTTVVGVMILMAGSGWTYVNKKFDGYDGLVVDRGERLQALEINFRNIEARLGRIDDKLDIVVEKLNQNVTYVDVLRANYGVRKRD